MRIARLTDSMAGSRHDNGLRQVVLDAIARYHEYILQMRSKVVLLYGATARIMADGICQIAVFRYHVTVVFPEGINLEDPGRVLRGAGRAVRLRAAHGAECE